MKMSKEKFDVWQDLSTKYLEMALKTDHCEIIERPDGYGKRTGECGDTIEFFLTMKGDRIEHVAFQTDGCMNTSACANTVVRMTEGRTVDEAWEISPENIIDFLETLPSHKAHCAELAVGALYLALANVKKNKQAPWKKLYQRN